MVYITTQILMIITSLFLTLTMMITFTQSTLLIEWLIMDLEAISIMIPVMVDPTSMIFMTTVLIIATSVMQFTKTYMKHDKSIDRFVLLVLLFVMSMMFLILFPHTMILLLGWDGLGITSFVLVIYYNNPKSLGAGLITALTNRIGDVMLLITIALMFNEGHWLIINTWHTELASWTSFTIIVAAMTKSAQMPFSSWLPAAMAAPTPVSALVHSSTLVTAGVYLLYRFSPTIQLWPPFQSFLMLIASMTMLMAGASAMAECDMKKIIALSTLSQVALMMFTLSMNLPEIAFFHLITHALFKALLFICAGNLIDIHHHSQDLRQMGNISLQLPTISSAITIANLALCGAPFMAGFYSKDLIIETMTMLSSEKNVIIIMMFITATVLTTAYSVRFSMYILMTATTSPVTQYSSESQVQINSIIILTLLAISGGAISNWLFIVPMQEPNFSSFNKFTALSMITLGVLMGTYFSFNKNKSNSLLTVMHCYMWFLTPLSTHLSPNMLMKLPLLELKETDQGWNLLPSMLFSQLYNSTTTITASQNNTTMLQIGCATLLTLWFSAVL